MKNKQNVRVDDYTDLCGHPAARPLKYVKDREEYGWLCDKEADPTKNLILQGCWRCDQMAFPVGF